MSGYCVQGDHSECPNFEDSCSCPCHLTVTLGLVIDNVYVDSGTVRTTPTVTVPALDHTVADWHAAANEWADEHLQEYTGTGTFSGDAGYFLTIATSTDPALVGLQFEWGI